MTPSEFVRSLEGEGFSIREKGGALAIRPARNVTPTMKQALEAHAADILVYLRERQARPNRGADWSYVSLYSLDRVLEVSVPWSDTRLLIAPGCRIARELRALDSKPGRVWCVCEVLDLLLSGVTPDDARRIAEAKIALDGTTTTVLADPPPPDDNPTGDWLWMCAKCRRACLLYVAGTDLCVGCDGGLEIKEPAKGRE